jgi:hypothetical protein
MSPDFTHPHTGDKRDKRDICPAVSRDKRDTHPLGVSRLSRPGCPGPLTISGL